ncbi:MAG: hemolysin III family protein [Clostridia bacterium]|nr:hemolysin III family protein [Clostridia bacterium]
MSEERIIKEELHGTVRSAKRLCRANVRLAKARYKRERCELLIKQGKPLPKDPPKRSILNEIGNSLTHGVGIIFAVIAFALMLYSSKTAGEIAGASIYFGGLLWMFTASCLYHALPHGTAAKRLFRRFDYTGIYLLIGATFAPSLLNVVGGTFGTVFFIIQWAVIAFGIVLVGVFGPARFRFIHIPLYVILGWSALMLMPWLIGKSFALAMWILAGGVIYTLGIIPYMIKMKVAHFIWHFFVLAGAAVQWVGIYIHIYLA